MLLIAVVVLLLSSDDLFAAEKRPAWIDGEAPFYSEEEYLTGVGYGSTRSEAEDQAYAAIAKIFRARVEARTRESEEVRQAEANGRVETKRTIDLGQTTEISSRKVLENVRISERWEEPGTRVQYALATLFRPQAAKSLTEKVGGLDREIRDALQRAEKAQDRLDALREFRRAERLTLLREAYNADLRVIQRSGRGIEPPLSSGAVREEIARFLSEGLTLSVSASGPEGGSLRPALVEGLSRQGFRVAQGEESDLLVRAEGEMRETDLQNPQVKFIRWEIRLDLVEGKKGKLVGSAGRIGREGHLSLAEAKVRARHAMEREASGPLIEELFKTLDGPEE
jgi:hypothetical protein